MLNLAPQQCLLELFVAFVADFCAADVRLLEIGRSCQVLYAVPITWMWLERESLESGEPPRWRSSRTVTLAGERVYSESTQARATGRLVNCLQDSSLVLRQEPIAVVGRRNDRLLDRAW